MINETHESMINISECIFGYDPNSEYSGEGFYFLNWRREEGEGVLKDFENFKLNVLEAISQWNADNSIDLVTPPDNVIHSWFKRELQEFAMNSERE